MKLNAIKKVCVMNGEFTVVNRPDGTQWIGNGWAFYPVNGITMTKENIPALFDIDEKKRSKYWIRDVDYTPDEDEPRLDINPMHEMEELCEIAECGIWHKNTLCRALIATDGVYLINVALLKPIESKDEYLEFYVRRSEGKSPVIACYGDMLVSAIVLPIRSTKVTELMGMLSPIVLREVAPCGIDENYNPADKEAEDAEVEAENLFKSEGFEEDNHDVE